MQSDERKKTVTLEIAGRKLTIETGEFALQSDGSVIVSLGDTVLIASATMKEEAKEEADFFPLTVDYEERFYATGKISGSRFIKREGRPSENAILTSRLIDRPIRPLFPEGIINDVQIICTVLSADLEVDPGTTAINAASAALMVSGLPFQGPLGAVRIGYLSDSEGKETLIVNPTYEQVEKGRLDLVVAGTMDAITMVEAGAREVSEEIMLQGMELAHQYIKQICELQLKLKELVNPTPKKYSVKELPQDVLSRLQSSVTEEMLDTIAGKTKHETKERWKELEEKVMAQFTKEIEGEIYRENDIKTALKNLIEEKMRSNILEKEKRVDSRKLNEIREIKCKVGLLPRTHGSGFFQRGETQALTITTLGSPGAAQVIDTMDEDTTKRYMHYYNFPPYSVGEVRFMRGASRREIGHGNLAERALEPVLPTKEEFPYTLRLVSEIFTCNGSSSMASICGSTLSLMDAGVPIKRPVAGIAMGLITDESFQKSGSGKYKILTDIQGLEDFVGDMDFKVGGTSEGITALQMDIKVKGISIDILRSALQQAKEARGKILEEMLTVIPSPRSQLSPYAPLIISHRIQPTQIREVIGRGGETIQKIIEETGAEIDIEDDGLVMITATNQESGNRALEIIKKITYIPKVGDSFEGKVSRMMEFGAFVEFAPGKEGLVHISELAPYHVNKVEDIVKLGDTVKVKLIKIDEQGRYNLSMRALQPGGTERPERGGPPPRPGGFQRRPEQQRGRSSSS